MSSRRVGPVYQAGTLSGNPIATAAGLAVLRELTPDRYFDLERRATRLTAGLKAAFEAAGIPVWIPQVGTLVGLFFHEGPVVDYTTSAASDADQYTRFFHGMLDRGFFLAPSSYEVLFPGLAHTDEDIDATIVAASDVAQTL